MFLKLYLISTAIVLVCWLSLLLKAIKDIKPLFTKDEWKEIKKKKDKRKYPIFIYLLLFWTPVVNVIFTVLAGIYFPEVEKELITDYKVKIGKMSGAERLLSSIRDLAKNLSKESEE